MATIREQLIENQPKLKDFNLGDKLVLKAAGTMLLANVTGETSTIVDPQIMPYFPIANSNYQSVLDYFHIVPVSSHTIGIVAQESDDQDAGGVASVAEGAAKEQVDFDTRVTQKSFTKYAVYSKVSAEMLEDIDFMNDLINRSLKRRLRDKIATDFIAAIYAGTGVLSSALTTGATVTANQEVMPSIYSGMKLLNGYEMNLWLLNNPDYTTMFNMAATGFATNTVWQDMMKPRIVPCAAVAATYICALDTNMFPLYVYKDGEIEIGYETADFINNLVTIRCESRVAWNISTIALKAMFKDTFSNVLARF